MAKQEIPTEPITMSSTKKEMLDAYNQLVKELQQRRETELKPEQRIEEKKAKQAVEVADSLSTEGIAKEIGGLKSEVGKMLAQLSDKLDEEVGKYLQIKKAVAVRTKELEEIYEVEKTASTLTALLEVQRKKRDEFDAEMAAQKEELEAEIEAARAEWQNERVAHEAEIKERTTSEKKTREREAEEYKYQFSREQQLAREQFDYEKAKLQREVQFKKEEMEKDLAARERAVAEREQELAQLREQMATFPKRIEDAVAKAVQEATERANREYQNKEELMKREFAGESNVLKSRIEALQQTVKEQTTQIAKLSAQLEKAYGQVQDIAVKAIEGPSSGKTLAFAVQPIPEPSRRTPQGEG